MKGVKKQLATKIADSLTLILNAEEASLGEKMQKLSTNASKKLAAKYVKQIQKMAKAEKKAAAKLLKNNSENPSVAPKPAKAKAEKVASPAPAEKSVKKAKVQPTV